MTRGYRAKALSIFKEGLKAVDPYNAVKRHIRVLGPKRVAIDGRRFIYDRLYVLGAGKAVCAMAKAVEELLGPDITEGLVVTKYGHGLRLKRTGVIEAGHPLPDSKGLKGAREVLKLAARATKGDLVIALISGGASALLPAPREGITLAHKQRITELLLRSGAEIQEINAVRKHLSQIKGGGLLKAVYPAGAVTLIVSDVVGDDLSTIASGPTSPDRTTFAGCLEVLERYGLTGKAPRAVIKFLKEGARGLHEETLKPGETIATRCRNIIVARNLQALLAAKKRASSLGFKTVVLTSMLRGDTRWAARFLASIAKEARRSGNPLKTPACILAGGETTLEVRGDGKGGRNQEFALVFALEVAGLGGITLLSAGTDGTDGPTDAAGAFADTQTIERALSLGMDPRAYLAKNDSYTFFKRLGDLIITGPTGTNVMDMAVVIVRGA